MLNDFFHCPSILPLRSSHSINLSITLWTLDAILTLLITEIIENPGFWQLSAISWPLYFQGSTIFLATNESRSIVISPTVISGLKESNTNLLVNDAGAPLISTFLMDIVNCMSLGPCHRTYSSHHLPVIFEYPFWYAYFPELLPSLSFCHDNSSISTLLSMVYLFWLAFSHLWNSHHSDHKALVWVLSFL